MAESGPGLQSRGILTALRAAAILIIATGLNDVIAGAVPRFEPLYVYLAAIALVVWLDGIILGTITSMVKSNAREKTRREIAAYIAEGSMTPEQGERLMAAGNPKK